MTLRTLATLITLLVSTSVNAYTYKLAFTEEFKGAQVNPKIWERIPAGKPDWCKHMDDQNPALVKLRGGTLELWGLKNKDKRDPRPFTTGGIMTKHHLGMMYGKIEAKVKLHDQQGAWPAIWMMPCAQPKGWPHDGEIDIVERLNGDDFVYQTVHSGYTQVCPGNPPHGGRGKFKKDDWNLFAIEWTPKSITWFVNGKATFSYKKFDDDPAHYPWTAPFYLMLDMQLQGNWVGKVNMDTLPVKMEIDFVKFYALYDDAGNKLTRFTRGK